MPVESLGLKVMADEKPQQLQSQTVDEVLAESLDTSLESLGMMTT